MFALFADMNTTRLSAILTMESLLELHSKIFLMTGPARFAALPNPTSKKLNNLSA